MGSDKTYIHKFYRELNNYDQSIVITLNIKDIVLIAYIINTIKGFLDICETGPFTFLYDGCPFLQGHFSIRMSFSILF